MEGVIRLKFEKIIDSIIDSIVTMHKKVGEIWQEKTGRTVITLVKLLCKLTIFFAIIALYLNFYKPDSLLIINAIRNLILLIWSALIIIGGKRIAGMIKENETLTSLYVLSWIVIITITILNTFDLIFNSSITIIVDFLSNLSYIIVVSATIIGYHDYEPPKKKETAKEKIKAFLHKLKPAPKPQLQTTLANQ